jgi:histone H3/H4
MKNKLASTGVIKPTVVTQYINRAAGMRAKKDAVAKLIADFDAVLAAVVVEAKNLARQDRRTTILKRDIVAALEKHLRRKDLPWDETAAEVIKHNPTDLGKISKTVRDWIREHEDTGRKKPRK